MNPFAFGPVSPHERRQADRFFAELHGIRTAPGWRRGAGESADESTDSELNRRRLELLGRVTQSDLYWHDIPLANGFRIRVSSPIVKDNLFIPATARESLALARRFEVFPLTRAVADQTHNAAIKVDYSERRRPPTLSDFVAFSASLNATPYGTSYGYALASGQHKWWVISSRGPTINYGFYIPRNRRDPIRTGRYVDPKYNVIQGLGARHDGGHWDYSQLLQFMTSLRDASGQPVDLRDALLNRHEAIWDEQGPPASGSLP
jgi:hypothetical protein